MAFSVDKMKEQQLLIKKMAASENLAFTNIICTGKTGTLTEGDMKVKEFMIAGRRQDFVPHKSDMNSMNKQVSEVIKSCIILNNDAKIEMGYNDKARDALYEPKGNPTEVAMLNFLY